MQEGIALLVFEASVDVNRILSSYRQYLNLSSLERLPSITNEHKQSLSSNEFTLFTGNDYGVTIEVLASSSSVLSRLPPSSTL